MGDDLSDNAKKFFFDNNDFSEEALRKKIEAARKPTYSAEQMEASKNAGFELGRKAGIQETIESQESQIRDVLQQVVIAAARLEQDERKRMATFIDQSALVAAQALTHAIPTLLDLMAAEQISSFMKSVLAGHAKSQSLTIHVAPLHFEQIEKRLNEMLATMNRKGICTVIADNNLSGLDCRFEWTGGGAEWAPGIVADQMLKTIISNLPEALQGQVAIPPQEASPTAPQGVDETGGTPHNDESAPGDKP